MKFQKLIISVILFLLIFNMSACGGGAELCRIEGADATFVIYGGANAITRVEVVSGGETVASVYPDYRVNDPWLDEDKENYGFALCDLNGDGIQDFVIKTVRTTGKERYLFYVNKNGEYRLEDALSDVVAPVFGDGRVSVTTLVRYNQPSYPGEPPMYELRQEETIYGWSDYGRLEIKQVNRYSYFSETDIYRYSILLPNDEGELESESDEWINPDKLDDHGLKPLK
ncbi:MAG: hypothetical protein ACI3XI_05510 [Eubacteriales bacterium]